MWLVAPVLDSAALGQSTFLALADLVSEMFLVKFLKEKHTTHHQGFK